MSPRCSRMLLLGALMLAFESIAVTESAYSEPNRVEMAHAANVPIDEAIKTASQKVPGMIIEAELEQHHDKLIWQLGVVTPENTIMEIRIDAETGAVIDFEEAKTRAKRVKRK